MRPSRWPAILMLLACLAFLPAARAQPPVPHIGYVFPAGGRLGTNFQVTVGGQFLNNVDRGFISGDGVKVELVEYLKPLTPKELNSLREKMRQLQKGPRDAETRKQLDEIRRKLAEFLGRRTNPAIADRAIFRISVAAEAAPGRREFRLGTPAGLSNPLVFCLDQLPESAKKAAKPPLPPEFLDKRPRFRTTQDKEDEAPTTITLPVIVNGQIMPGGADRYRFSARKGAQLLVAVNARELIPYLPDAVPGWFQASLTLFDAQGNELSYADHFRFHPDPVLHYVIPRDGQYTIEIHDSVYRGREDFVYRIAVGELPFVTGIFPLGGRIGSQGTVELTGWNLPLSSLPWHTKDQPPGVYPLVVHKGQWLSNTVPFALDTLPECLEHEPNDSPAAAQRVSLPIVVNGRIDRPGDRDVFSFEGHAGQEIVAEVLARRLDSPLDSVLRLTDAAGRQLAFNDDYEDKGCGLNTHHADSWLSAKLPAEGTYYLTLSDAQRKGGPEYAYRVRISPPRPDFELRVTPSSINGARATESVPLKVYALRKDGFLGEIVLQLKNAPDGFALSGGYVPAGAEKSTLTLAVPANSLTEPVNLSIEGHAMIDGREVVRPVVPAEDMMQAFAYRHLVPVKELKVAVWTRRLAGPMMHILGKTPVRIPAGGTARLRLGADLGAMALLEQFRFELHEPPEGISVRKITLAGKGIEIEVQADAAKVKPGLKGNLIVDAFATEPPPGAKGKFRPNRPRAPVGALPAIPFEIVRR
jgi:hypothetical protein